MPTQEKNILSPRREALFSLLTANPQKKYTIVASQLSTTISFLFPLIDGQTQLAC
jgi:hypothetical protein